MISAKLLNDIQKYLDSHQIIQHYSVLEIEPAVYEKTMPLEGYLQEQKQPPFSEVLFQLITTIKMNETGVYKKAGIDRRHFAKIRADRTGKTYHPGKKTVLSLCLALNLNKNQADNLRLLPLFKLHQ